MRKFIKEFKEFANKGNVMGLAIAVLMGTAFNNIVTSLANNIITPLLGIIIGRIDISKLSVTIPPFISGFPSIELDYGIFLQAVINFLLIALIIFLASKALGKLQKKEPEPSEPELTRSEALLSEIRDLLKNGKGGLPSASGSDLQDNL